MTGQELSIREAARAYSELTPDVCYRVAYSPGRTNPEETVQFAVSPDGLGCVWYDTLAEVSEDRGDLPIIRVSETHFEELRIIADNNYNPASYWSEHEQEEQE